MEKIIEVNNLNHAYRSHKKRPGLWNSLKDLFHREYDLVQALKNVSFEINQGEIVGLLGPNGAGKTTLLKILSGIIYPSSGLIQVMKKTPYNKERSLLQKIGMVMGQKSQLLWDIPALDTLHIIRELYEIPAPEFTQRLSEFSSLLAVAHLLETPVRKLSLGERMKLELIAALIHNPPLLFLDEPTIGLDIVSQRAIRDFLLNVNRQLKTTIIITSHYMKDIEILAKRILIIKDGSILIDDSLSKLLKKFEHFQKVYFTTIKEDFQLSLPFEKVSQDEYSVRCHLEDLGSVIGKISHSVPILSIRTEETSLEDTLFSLFSEKAGK